MWLGKMASAASILSPLPPGIDNLRAHLSFTGICPALNASHALTSSERKAQSQSLGSQAAAFPIQFRMYSEYLLCSGLAQMLEAWKETNVIVNPPSRVQAISGARNAQEESSATRQSWLAP